MSTPQEQMKPPKPDPRQDLLGAAPEEEVADSTSQYPVENWGSDETSYWEAVRQKQIMERKQARAEKRSNEDMENPPRLIKDLKERVETWEQPHLTSRSFQEEVSARQFSDQIPLTHQALNPHTKIDEENRRRLCTNLHRQLREETERAKESGLWDKFDGQVREDAEAGIQAGVITLVEGGVMEVGEDRVREILREMIGARRAMMLQ